MRMRDPEDVCVMRFYRRVDDEAAKEAMDVIEELRQRTGFGFIICVIFKRRPPLGGLFPACAVPSLFGFIFPVGCHDEHQQREDVSSKRQYTRAAARPKVPQSLPSILLCAAHQRRAFSVEGAVM